jgi:hypothetical protein
VEQVNNQCGNLVRMLGVWKVSGVEHLETAAGQQVVGALRVVLGNAPVHAAGDQQDREGSQQVEAVRSVQALT